MQHQQQISNEGKSELLVNYDIVILLKFNSLMIIIAEPLDIRLVGGLTKYEGTVEVYFRGEWGSICDDLWGIEDAKVVCRQLHLGEAVSAKTRAYFGRSELEPIHFDDVECQGEESTLSECLMDALQICNHLEDAGVVCSGHGKFAFSCHLNFI